MKHLADLFFRFPDGKAADRDFVRLVLNLARVPMFVVDGRLKVLLTNLQGEEMLLRLDRAVPKHRRRGDDARLPAALRTGVTTCLKTGHFRVVSGVGLPGLRSDRYDAVICPGRLEGVGRAFVLMLPPGWDAGQDSQAIGHRILESFDAAIAHVDRDCRYQHVNSHFIGAFRLGTDVMGQRISEVNPSRQTQALERQIGHIMASGEVGVESLHAVNTVKVGVVFTSALVWPLCAGGGDCVGLVAALRPLCVAAPLPTVDTKAAEHFGRIAVLMGPPMFFTQLDGQILVINETGKALLEPPEGDGNLTVQTAIPWGHPEIIEKLYADVIDRTGYSAVLTDIETPGGARLFRVTAHGIKTIGNVTSEILLHVQDVTEAETVRAMLTNTARKLATEKEILDKVIGGLRVAYAVVDRNLRVIRVSDSIPEYFQAEPGFFIGKSVTEIDPSTRGSGILKAVRGCIEEEQEIHLDDVVYTVPGVGRRVLLELHFYPVKVEGQPACLVAAENLIARQVVGPEYQRKSQVYVAMFGSIQEGVVVLDMDRRIVEVNRVISDALGSRPEDLRGRPAREIIVVKERGMLEDFIDRAYESDEPIETGVLRLSRVDGGGEVFVDISYFPLIGEDGRRLGIVIINRFLTKVKHLEEQIKGYTQNLERLVDERTRELSEANTRLEITVKRLASMAESGMVLSSLQDLESVMASFLREAREVLDADFVSVALVDSMGTSSKTTYFSSGDKPPHGRVPHDLVEKKMAGLVLEGPLDSEPEIPQQDLLVLSFVFSGFRGLFMAWRRSGTFSSIDKNLSRLLCTQLGFSVPITMYVTDLRRARDRSQCLRRIAFRVTGAPSVAGGIGVVAEELSKAMQVDRFFWIVSSNGREAWISEVYRRAGRPEHQPQRVGPELSDCLRPMLKAGYDTHRDFCEISPWARGEDIILKGRHAADPGCPFVGGVADVDLVGFLERFLRSLQMIGGDSGSLAVAPVTLGADAWGILCAYSDLGGAFSADDTCFMCLASSTVAYVWQAADAVGNVRRLEAAGETISELAHDLKYPLLRMRESISRLGSCDPECLPGGPAYREIKDEIGNLNLLAQELIDLSSPKTRKHELIDLAEVIDYCLALTSGDLAKRSVTVGKSVDPGLPPVFAHRKDVKSILLQVLANCIDAAGEGGRVEIDTETAESPAGVDCIRILVRDSGPGVPVGETDKIFDPFYSRKDGGSGVGLFSARKRANANGGDVLYETDGDGESRFVIWFPVASG